jgi:hypothetical protein
MKRLRSVANHPVLIDSSLKNDYNSSSKLARKTENLAKGGTIVGQNKNLQNFPFSHNRINTYKKTYCACSSVG